MSAAEGIAFDGCLVYDPDGGCVTWGGAREDEMPATVNLDAMIKREDLDVTDKSKVQISLGVSLKFYELERDSTTFHILRKPDFQRETANWSPEKVTEMVFSFVEGDLIPSIIV